MNTAGIGWAGSASASSIRSRASSSSAVVLPDPGAPRMSSPPPSAANTSRAGRQRLGRLARSPDQHGGRRDGLRPARQAEADPCLLGQRPVEHTGDPPVAHPLEHDRPVAGSSALTDGVAPFEPAQQERHDQPGSPDQQAGYPDREQVLTCPGPGRRCRSQGGHGHGDGGDRDQQPASGCRRPPWTSYHAQRTMVAHPERTWASSSPLLHTPRPYHTTGSVEPASGLTDK